MHKTLFIIATSILFSLALTTNAFASENEYQELTYQDLLTELQTKHRTVVNRQSSELDSVKLLLGIGFAQSTSRFFINNQDVSRAMTGIQLSIGVDLFSENWYSEGVFKNFGLNTTRTDSYELKEFALRLGYKDKIADKISFNLATGLSTRYLDFKDKVNQQSYNQTTPSLGVSAGVRMEASPFANIGLEATARNSLVKDTIDRESYDILVKLEASL